MLASSKHVLHLCALAKHWKILKFLLSNFLVFIGIYIAYLQSKFSALNNKEPILNSVNMKSNTDVQSL